MNPEALSYTSALVVAGQKVIARDVALRAAHGECLVLWGANGCGKTTLIRDIVGLNPVSRDRRLLLDGMDRSSVPASVLSGYGVMYVPQSGWLFETLTIFENIRLYSQCCASAALTTLEVANVTEALVGIPAGRLVSQLSGGERKLVETAVALAAAPSLLLLDEPLAGLSPDNAFRCCQFLNQLLDGGSAIVLAEHRQDIQALKWVTCFRIEHENVVRVRTLSN